MKTLCRVAVLLFLSMGLRLPFEGGAYAQTTQVFGLGGQWSNPDIWTAGVPTGGSDVVVTLDTTVDTVLVDSDASYLTLDHRLGNIVVASGATFGVNQPVSTSIQSPFRIQGTARAGGLNIISRDANVVVDFGGTLHANQVSMADGFFSINGTVTASSFVTQGTGSPQRISDVVIAGSLTTSGGPVSLGNASISNFQVRINGGTWSSRPSAGIFSIGASDGGTFIVSDGGVLTVANSSSALGAGDGSIRLAENFGGVATRDSLLLIGSSFAPFGAPGTVSAAEVNGASSRAVVRFRHSSGDYTFATPLTGSLRVEQEGGTTILSAVNTYTGATSITGGQLIVNGSATGTTLTLAGGTLGGSGAVGAVIFTSGVLAPGNSPGTLTVASLDWSGGAMQFELGATAAMSDQLVIDGLFSKGGDGLYQFDFIDGASLPVVGATYTLLTFGGSQGFTTDDFSYVYLGAHATFVGEFALGANALTFTLAAIPEPASAAWLAGVLTLGMGAMRRRQRD